LTRVSSNNFKRLRSISTVDRVGCGKRHLAPDGTNRIAMDRKRSKANSTKNARESQLENVLATKAAHGSIPTPSPNARRFFFAARLGAEQIAKEIVALSTDRKGDKADG
jgi:hypothetical protein